MSSIIPALCIICATQSDADALNEAGVKAERTGPNSVWTSCPKGWTVTGFYSGTKLIKSPQGDCFSVWLCQGVYSGVGAKTPSALIAPYPTDGRAVVDARLTQPK